MASIETKECVSSNRAETREEKALERPNFFPSITSRHVFQKSRRTRMCLRFSTKIVHFVLCLALRLWGRTRNGRRIERARTFPSPPAHPCSLYTDTRPREG